MNLDTNELTYHSGVYGEGVIQNLNTTPINGKYLLYTTKFGRFTLYDTTNNTMTQVNSTNLSYDYNNGIMVDDKVLMQCGYLSSLKYVYDFSTGAITKLYTAAGNDTFNGFLMYDQLVKTSQGIFAITKWSTDNYTSSNYNFCYKYNEDSGYFDLVKYGTGDGTVLAPKYKAQIYETPDGVIFMSYDNTNDWNVHIYDGTKFISSGYSASYSFYGVPMFSIGSHNCYLKDGKIYEFVGTKIQLFINLNTTNTITFARVFEFSNGNYFLMTSYRNYLINGETNIATEIDYSVAETLYANDKSYFLFVDDTVYYSSTSKSFAISNDGTTTILHSGEASTSTLCDYQKVNGKIVAFSQQSSYVYPLVLEDDAFVMQNTSIARNGKKYTLKKAYGRGNYIYFVFSNTANYKRSSSLETWASEDDLDVYRYNVQDKTLDKLDGRKVCLHLGNGNYWSATDKKVYNFETGASENVSFSSVALFSDGLDGSNGENLWSPYSLAMNVTTTSISVLYVN